MKLSGRVARKSLKSEKPNSLRIDSAKRDAALHLGLDLVLAHEQVGVVLGEAADAQQAVQHARALVAVDRAQLGQRSGRSRYERSCER